MAGCERMSRTVAHGWNVDYSAHTVTDRQYCPSGRGTRIRDRVCRARCWVLRERPSVVVSWMPASCRALPCGVSGLGVWSLFENCTVDASICGQVFKGARWMPWHQEPMKDVGGRDRPRGAVNRALIRGCPNGETRQSSWAVTHT